MQPPTRLEAFIIANKIHRGKLAYASRYTIAYVRDIRLGLAVPRPEVMEAIARACGELLGRVVAVHDIFDVDPLAPFFRPLTCNLSALFVRGEREVVAYVPEIPGVHAQGVTIEEAKNALGEALELVLAANRMDTGQAFEGHELLHREVVLSLQPPWPAHKVAIGERLA